MNSKELSKEEVLKPCPFCNSVPELILRGNAFTKKRNAEIKCNKCGAEIVVGAIHNSLEWCSGKVIEKWNNRPHASHEVSRVIGELVVWMEEERRKYIGKDSIYADGIFHGISDCIQKAKSLLKQEGEEKCKHCGSIWLESDGKKTQCRSCYKWWKVKQEGE